MKLSEKGRAILENAEGLRLHVYWDGGSEGDGFRTIGRGHKLTDEEIRDGVVRIGDEHVAFDGGITEEQADQLLLQDIAPAEEAVRDFVRVPLSQGQFDALVLFAFNVGRGAFGTSTLRRLLNEGAYAKVPHELGRWVNSAGRRMKGLVHRREMEVALWNSH